jgi:hypothetical protein
MPDFLIMPADGSHMMNIIYQAHLLKCAPPSRQWPYSYLKHFYTKKYAKKLAEAKPMAYMFLAGLKPESERGKQLIAMHAANRMRCGSQYAGEGAHG